MPLTAPTRRLMHHVGLEFVQKKVEGGGHRSTNASLSLTSMIDFLVVTVVFLLMTFSASGETPIAKGLNLPKAENTLDMIDAPVAAVVGSQILVDGSPAGNTRAVAGSSAISFRIASDALPWARASSILPSSTSTTIAAAASK